MTRAARAWSAVLSMAAVASCGQGEATRAAAGATSSAVPAPAPASAPAPAAPPPMRLSVARSPRFGAYLTANGRAVYLLESESGAPPCTGSCLIVWPALVAARGAAVTGDSLARESLIGTTARPEGAAQVTYAGQPLYLYLGDTGPGQTLGQHVEDAWGEWYLVSPTGGEVEAGEERGGRRGRRADDR